FGFARASAKSAEPAELDLQPAPGDIWRWQDTDRHQSRSGECPAFLESRMGEDTRPRHPASLTVERYNLPDRQPLPNPECQLCSYFQLFVHFARHPEQQLPVRFPIVQLRRPRLEHQGKACDYTNGRAN